MTRRRATSRASSTGLAERVPRLGLDVMQVWRNDRFGRGGDHTEFLNAGFPAVRFSVAVENYNHQHQDLRIENGVEYGDTIDKMDFPYLAKVTKLNVAALAWLASAPPPPEPTVEGAVSTDTTMQWRALPGCRPLRCSMAAHGCEPVAECRAIRRADICRSHAVSRTAPVCAPLRSGCTGYNCLQRHPRRRLGVRRLVGQQGRLRKPGRLGRPRRRVQALGGASAGHSPLDGADSSPRYRRPASKSGSGCRPAAADRAAAGGHVRAGEAGVDARGQPRSRAVLPAVRLGLVRDRAGRCRARFRIAPHAAGRRPRRPDGAGYGGDGAQLRGDDHAAAGRGDGHRLSVPIFSAVLAAIVLGEPTGKWRWGAVAAGFLGVLLIVQPGTGEVPLFGASVALVAALLTASVTIVIRRLGATERASTTVFWFAASSLRPVRPADAVVRPGA